MFRIYEITHIDQNPTTFIFYIYKAKKDKKGGGGINN